MEKIKDLFLKILNIRKSDNDFIKYLKKYDYVFDNIPPQNHFETDSSCIWVLWLQGIEDSPLLVKKCISSIKKYNPDRKVIILNKENIKNYISVPSHIEEKYRKKIISGAHYSDYIRVAILAKYGGIWIDATVLLTGVIPQKIWEEDLFFFKSIAWFHDVRFADSFNKNLIPKDYVVNLISKFPWLKTRYPSVSNWFIRANSNNEFIILIKYFLEEFWKKEDSIKNYLAFHLFIYYAIIKSDKYAQIWNNMLSISNRDVHILQSYFHEKFNLNKYCLIKKMSPIHKLTYKFSTIKEDSFLEYLLKQDDDQL